MSARTFFSKKQQQDIITAIKEAESNTSGEIRVHIENHSNGAVLDRAAFIFKELKMEDTAARNGVLIYIALKDKQFAIIGDEGINKMVEKDFWNDVKDEMAEFFKSGNFTEGVVKGILRSGEKLKKYFPHQDDDVNELSDEISFR